MDSLTSRSRGTASCYASLMTISIAILMISISITAVQARSEPKDDDIEANLNRVTKATVKTVTMQNGDIVNCVDMYKQPAFDHPLLKDHKLLTAPSFIPKMDKIEDESLQLANLEAIWQDGEECPEGTVPILRLPKRDLTRANVSLYGYEPQDGRISPKVERAGMVARAENGAYYGAIGWLNIWEMKVEENEWSRTEIQLGDSTQQAFIDAGFAVNPSLFKDHRPRIYIYWTSDAYGSTGCYECAAAGFFQKSRKIFPGQEITPISVYGGPQYHIRVHVYKDDALFAWWLVINEEWVGYWPIDIFQKAKLLEAKTATWMGAVMNERNNGKHTVTQMGSGHFPKEGEGKAAYIRQFQVTMTTSVNGSYNKPDVPSRLDLFDSPSCYDARDLGDIVYYGGPGLSDSCT